MISYKAFTDAIRQEIWPFPGEPKNQVPAHSKFFLEAMVEIQRWVPCLQVNNTDIFRACSTYVQCGLTVFGAPTGLIKRVYTVANGEYCDPVYYGRTEHCNMLAWQRCLVTRFTAPSNTGMPALQQGFKFHEASVDSTLGRARTGMWSMERGRLYIAPWIQSNESVVVEWDGHKSDWKADDVLDNSDGMWDPAAAAVVKLYVQKCHERDFGCNEQRRRALDVEYREKLADLKYFCEERRKSQETCDANALNARGPTQAEVVDDAVPSESDEVVAAFIADFDGGQATLDVAELVDSWSPAYVVTGGDNFYGNDVTLAALDASVGPAYSHYIHPYLGTLGEGGAVVNQFFPAVGNHDRDPDGRLAVFLNYFNRSKPYYDFIQGNVHWFIVDGGYMNDKTTVAQPDGNTFDSVQGESFKLRMALSTARWKIVVLGFPPYASTSTVFPALRWPFSDWGADLVLTGDFHLYERLLAPEGYPLIVAGWSGRTRDTFGSVSPYSLVRYADNYGALKLTASCDELKVEAINILGTVVDTLTLEKA